VILTGFFDSLFGRNKQRDPFVIEKGLLVKYHEDDCAEVRVPDGVTEIGGCAFCFRQLGSFGFRPGNQFFLIGDGEDERFVSFAGRFARDSQQTAVFLYGKDRRGI
jgi:hypothetical protein